MDTLRIAAGIALVAFHSVCFAQADVPCGQTLEAALHSGAALSIDSRAAGIEIVGTDQQAIHVSCTSEDAETTAHTRLRLSGTPTRAVLRITGPHLDHSGPQIRIEVPRKVNLGIQMPAGQVKVDDVVGDKDIQIHAGQITISSNHTWDYRKVDVSVGIGQVNAQVYGASRGGFFREFHKENANGEYRLHAHLATGQIDLLGKSAHTTTDPE